MTSRHAPVNRTFGVENLGDIGAKKPKVVGAPAKEYNNSAKAVIHDITIYWRIPEPHRSQFVLFYSDPEPIPKQELRLRVTGVNGGKRTPRYHVDHVEFLDPCRPLGPAEARALCERIIETLKTQLAPQEIKNFTTDLLDIEILKGSRTR